jgi:hypothetical protein
MLLLKISPTRQHSKFLSRSLLDRWQCRECNHHNHFHTSIGIRDGDLSSFAADCCDGKLALPSAFNWKLLSPLAWLPFATDSLANLARRLKDDWDVDGAALAHRDSKGPGSGAL